MDRSYHRAAYEHHRAKAAAYRSKAEQHLARASAHHSRLGFGGKKWPTPIIPPPEKPWNCPCECKSKEEHYTIQAALDKVRAVPDRKYDVTSSNKPALSNPGMYIWRP
jgi:hypothetical protein